MAVEGAKSALMPLAARSPTLSPRVFDTRAVLQQPISLALAVEPKAQLLVLHGLCRRT